MFSLGSYVESYALKKLDEVFTGVEPLDIFLGTRIQVGWVGVGVSFGRIVRLVGPEYSEDGFHGRFLLVVLLQLLLVVGVEASTRLLGYFVKSNLFVVLRWLFHTCVDGLMNLQICTLSKASATD